MAIGHQSFYQTALTSAINSTDLIIPLDTVPTVSEGFLVIESTVEAKREIIYYTSKDATTVTCPSGAGNGRGYDGTTAVSHTQGAAVIMAPVGVMFEKFGTVSLGGINDTNGNELLKVTATASAVNELTLANAATGNNPSLSATGGDTNVGINLVPKGTGEVQIAGTPISGAWQSWTPTWSNLTLGSATVVARYKQVGKTVFYQILVTLNGSTMGSGPTFTLPVTADTSVHSVGVSIIGHAIYNDSGAAEFPGHVLYSSSTTGWLRAVNTTTTYGNSAVVSSTVPLTWGNSDKISVHGFYEAA